MNLLNGVNQPLEIHFVSIDLHYVLLFQNYALDSYSQEVLECWSIEKLLSSFCSYLIKITLSYRRFFGCGISSFSPSPEIRSVGGGAQAPARVVP